MNDLQIFKNEQFGTIRTVMQDGEPWFVAADVCKDLEHSNDSMALDRLDDDEKAKLSLGLSGGETNVVNEPGLYTLILGSRKPEAKAFKRWITHDVLPAIRKTGMYVQPGTVTNALAELHAAMTAMQDMLDDVKQRIPRSTSMDLALTAHAEGRLEPWHLAGHCGKAHSLLDREAIAHKITIYLIEEDMTLDDLAQQVGVSAMSVSRWRRGENAPAGKSLEKICEILGCDIADLLK